MSTPNGVVGWKMALKLGAKTIAKAQNVDLDAGAGEVDMTTRSSDGWWEGAQGIKNWSLSGDQLWVATDEGLDAILDSYLNGTYLAAEITAPSGAGFTGTVFITSVKLGQPLDGAVGMPFAAKGTGALAKVSAAS
jgi:predicted secreted protein